MIITLSKEEALEYFYNALCNAVSTGYMKGYGLEFDYDDKEYEEAKQILKSNNEKSICIEDVWIQILKNGGFLTFKDTEGDGEMTRSINIYNVIDRVRNMPIDHLSDMINEQDDAVTADILLQTVFFEDVIFG